LDAVHLFINRVGQDNHWVQLVLRGTKTNRSGVGARVSLTAGGSTQIREVKEGGGHFNNQSTKLVQIGLGQGTAIDKVTVRWAGGETETFAGVSADQRWLLVEGSGKAEAWSPPADPCAECGAGTVCLDAKCVPDEEAVFARLVQFHAAIEGEDIVALMSHFDPATYEAGADVLLPLNSPVKPLFEVKARFEQMFASLAQIQFDALVTGDGLGNPYAMPDEDTILIADFTPLSGVVEDPAGGYMWVSELQAGDSWYEEHSEGWYNFLFRKVGGSWHAVAFGIGNQ
jgi:hypothetical protein